MESLELFRLMLIIQAWYFLRQVSNYCAIYTRAVHQRFVQASGTMFFEMRVIQDCQQLLKELSTLFVTLLGAHQSNMPCALYHLSPTIIIILRASPG